MPDVTMKAGKAYLVMQDERRVALEEPAAQLRGVRLVETIPGQVRIQHDSGRHDDRCVTIGMAVVPLVRQATGVRASRCPPARCRPHRRRALADRVVCGCTARREDPCRSSSPVSRAPATAS